MKADLFYTTVFGRMLIKILQTMGFFRLASWFLHTRMSRYLVPVYIKKNDIDMRPFAEQRYESFADFFARKRNDIHCEIDTDALISPCDGLLSIYNVTEDLTISMKGSIYSINDLVPDKETAAQFQGGYCLVFRLEASDYHHFCCIDDGLLAETNYIPGQLHSVQPIAQRAVPVFRLNRRWWSILKTKNFGTAIQIEVGAMLVGGVSFFIEDACFRRGDEMGCFELAGSTIVLLLNACVREKLALSKYVDSAVDSENEVRVRMGTVIGKLKDKKQDFQRYAF